jgi:hypothetical protein
VRLLKRFRTYSILKNKKLKLTSPFLCCKFLKKEDFKDALKVTALKF